MKKFYLSTLTLLATLQTSFGQTTFTNLSFLSGNAQNTEVLSQTTNTQVLVNNTFIGFSTINDATAAKLTTENIDNKDFYLAGASTTGALGAATVTLNPNAAFSRVRADHSFTGAVATNNPGTVISNTFTLKFNGNLTVTDATFNFTSLNTAGVAWEYSVIQFLDASGNPFSTLTNPGFTVGAAAQYITANATTGFSGQAGIGNFIAAKTTTVTGVGTANTTAGTNGTNDNLATLNYIQMGLAAGTRIGGVRWTTYFEDVRGTGNTSPSLTASLLDFTISGSISTVVLSVDKLTFTGAKQKQINVLKWQTENEINNKGFDIQSSNDGVSFSKIAFVNATAVNGGNQSYFFEDKRAACSTKQYYRLAVVDNNNIKKNSDIIFIKGLNSRIEVSTFPNPVVNLLTLNVQNVELGTNALVLAVYNTQGKLYFTRNTTLATGYNSIRLNVEALPKGAYIIKFVNNGTEEFPNATFIK